MGFFSSARQGRKDDVELGKGLWRRANDRFTRGLDRYHQILEGVEDEALYAELLAAVRGRGLMLSALEGKHPRELMEHNQTEGFVRRMTDGLRTFASAFAPRSAKRIRAQSPMIIMPAWPAVVRSKPLRRPWGPAPPRACSAPHRG